MDDQPSTSSCSSSTTFMTNQKNILDLPEEIIAKIFRHISYEQISVNRIICRKFHRVGSYVLNKDFYSLKNFIEHLFQSIKNQLPKRESARRKHILAKEFDIIEILNMRLALLHMTFGKYIKRNYCCFFPGEIMDEIYRILKNTKQKPLTIRTSKITDELYDLTTMAIDYFKESIEPNLPDLNNLFLEIPLEPLPNLQTSLSSLEKRIMENGSRKFISRFKSSKMRPLLDTLQIINDVENIENDLTDRIIEEWNHIQLMRSNEQHQQKFDSFDKNTTIRLKRLEKTGIDFKMIQQEMKTFIETNKRKYEDEYRKQNQKNLIDLERKIDGIDSKFDEILNELKEMVQNKLSHHKSFVFDASTQTVDNSDDTIDFLGDSQQDSKQKRRKNK